VPPQRPLQVESRPSVEHHRHHRTQAREEQRRGHRPHRARVRTGDEEDPPDQSAHDAPRAPTPIERRNVSPSVRQHAATRTPSGAPRTNQVRSSKIVIATAAFPLAEGVHWLCVLQSCRESVIAAGVGGFGGVHRLQCTGSGTQSLRPRQLGFERD